MTAPRQKNQLVSIAASLIALALIGFAGFSYYRQHEDQRAIEGWLKSQPVNAMVLERHPTTYPRFFAHFLPYLAQESGQAGLERGQVELQQILNVNYLTDYIWTVKDAELREYVRTLLALMDRLVVVQRGQSGLCEAYWGNSALYAQVDQTAGGTYFADFMQASERLFLSARDGHAYKITPDHGNYYVARDAANAAFWRVFRQQHPGLRGDALQRAADLFDPLRSCAGYAEYLRALYAMEPGFMSLHWRAGMEADRPQFEALRRQRGSE